MVFEWLREGDIKLLVGNRNRAIVENNIACIDVGGFAECVGC